MLMDVDEVYGLAVDITLDKGVVLRFMRYLFIIICQ